MGQLDALRPNSSRQSHDSRHGRSRAAHEIGTKKLLYLGSSCIYPRHAAQPITEEELLTGPLEPTNEGRASQDRRIKLCATYRSQYGDDFISAMPTNLMALATTTTSKRRT
ncbi:MAG: NAD-dependent epimerase/dehydratase family protein [Acidimicrobiales bacterium]